MSYTQWNLRLVLHFRLSTSVFEIAGICISSRCIYGQNLSLFEHNCCIIFLLFCGSRPLILNFKLRDSSAYSILSLAHTIGSDTILAIASQYFSSSSSSSAKTPLIVYSGAFIANTRVISSTLIINYKRNMMMVNLLHSFSFL